MQIFIQNNFVFFMQSPILRWFWGSPTCFFGDNFDLPAPFLKRRVEYSSTSDVKCRNNIKNV